MNGKALLAGAAAFALAATAMANDPKEFFGDGGMIPDEDPNGFRSEIFVDEHGSIKEFKAVNLFDLNHTWAGDLQIFLTHKDTGTTVTLLDRPGVPETTFGDSADFLGDYTWVDGGFVYDADEFDEFVPTDRDYGPVSGNLNDFVDEDKFGTWSLLIVDNAGGDTGGLGSWSFVVNNPAPGTIALLAAAGVCGRRRRRR